jgi:DNA-directed RNA polymerase subunit RPC12/RpoP
MKLIPVVCPKCGAQIQVYEGAKTCYCTYCGAQILFDDDGTKVTYRKVDEARIKEADVKQLLALKVMEIEEKKRQDRIKALKTVAIVSGIIFSLALIVGLFNSDTGYLLGMVSFIVLGFGVLLILQGNDNKKKSKYL